jgi:cell division protein FtsI/penicillin-binding protein 2
VLSDQMPGATRRTGGRSRAALVAVAAAVVLLAAAAAVAVVVARRPPGPESAARAVAAAWSAQNWSRLPYDGVTGAQVTRDYTAATRGLDAQKVTVRAGKPRSVKATATVALDVTWILPGGIPWHYTTAATLHRSGAAWRAVWSPALIHPSLQRGQLLVADRTQPVRAEILGRGGTPLVTQRPVVNVGVEPSKTPDPQQTAVALGRLLGVDAGRLAQRIRQANTDAFVEVITLRQPDYAPLASRVEAVPGVVTSHGTLALAPTKAFARAVLGSTGPATAELVQGSQGRIRAGDVVGLGGLQKQYDRQLAGIPGITVDIVRPTQVPGRQRLFQTAPRPGKPLQTTLDFRTQSAADAALAGYTQPASLVAVDVRSGDVLAVSNAPADGYDNALLGRFSPGSTFKVVTTQALLSTGFDVDAPVACPKYAVVDGKSFHNYQLENFGPVPFHVDFARSCNTAVISQAPRLSPTALQTAARQLGLGGSYDLGTDAFAGSVPPTTSAVDRAAAAFGQGRVTVSPLSMAVVAASVARGAAVSPHLVTGTTSPTATGASTTTAPGTSAVPAATAAQLASLRGLLREVVTSGTAANLRSVPGGPVSAKTGTAEYGTGAPPKTHGWLVGYQGDVAFAVWVQDAESGSGTAGPAVQTFLAALR